MWGKILESVGAYCTQVGIDFFECRYYGYQVVQVITIWTHQLNIPQEEDFGEISEKYATMVDYLSPAPVIGKSITVYEVRAHKFLLNGDRWIAVILEDSPSALEFRR